MFTNTVKSHIVKYCAIYENCFFYYYYYFNIFLNVIYSCDGKAEFSAAITLVFSVIYDPSENILIC